MVVNPSFGKNKSLYQLHLFYLLDLRSSPLDICCLGRDCYFVCAGFVWTCSRNFTVKTLQLGLNLCSFTRTRFIVFTLLWVNSEVPVWSTRKFRVHLQSCPNSEVSDLLTRKFRVWQTMYLIRCIWVKIYRCAYSPPASRRHYGPLSNSISRKIKCSK